MPAPTARAEFLRAAERFAVAENPTIAARWGEEAADSQQSSPLAAEAAAAAEATRQLAQLAQVRARDLAVIEGVHADLEGRTVRLAYAGRLGIAGDADLLVIRSRVDWNAGTTEIEGEVIL
jgi:pyruvate/2-oxoglutarate dehydrogenase complex dihydrolipoamide acyltransferase (E2) component